MEEILLRLDPEDVENLKETNQNYSNAIKRIEKDEEYWRKKLSDYLEFEVFDRNGSTWKEIYKNAVEAKKDFLAIVGYGYAEIIEGLIKLGVDPGQNNDEALVIAVKKGYADIVEILLRNPEVNPNTKEGLPLREASRNGHIEVLPLLLNHPKFKHKYTNLAIDKAISAHKMDIIELLVNGSGIRLSNIQKQRILIVAAKHNDLKLAKKALKNLNRIRHRNSYEFAIENNNSEMLRLLLEKSDINYEKEAEDLLDLAMEKGNLEIIKLLASEETVLAFLDNERYLRTAVRNNDVELVKFLLEKVEVFVDKLTYYIARDKPEILAILKINDEQ